MAVGGYAASSFGTILFAAFISECAAQCGTISNCAYGCCAGPTCCTYSTYYYTNYGMISGISLGVTGLITIIMTIIICCRRRRARAGVVYRSGPVVQSGVVIQQGTVQTGTGYPMQLYPPPSDLPPAYPQVGYPHSPVGYQPPPPGYQEALACYPAPPYPAHLPSPPSYSTLAKTGEAESTGNKPTGTDNTGFKPD
ncbi:protein shisa-5-like [Physella acuta]|uniref:protein shisa-5-like n=1 Tax=Physella acuta TaxID=109671 RepID=UPI0027DCC4DA|nr:protein shisa-5-like [Physella acuta]